LNETQILNQSAQIKTFFYNWCNLQSAPAQRCGLVGGSQLKSGLFNQYVIVGISEKFGDNHAGHRKVTPALAHDRSYNYSSAQRP
jgi:hypothetical protein